MDFELTSGKRGGGRAVRAVDGTRRFLVLADFGGRQSRDILESGDALATRPLIRVHPEGDSFDAAMAKVAPRLALPAALTGAGPPLPIESLADLHPDTLFHRLPVFRSEVGGQSAERGSSAAAETHDDLVARLLGRASGSPSASPRAEPTTAAVVDSLIGKILAAQAPPAPSAPGAPDAGTAGRAMRALLRAPGFQALEATWRGLQLLVSRADEDTEIWLLDVSKPELATDLLSAGGGLERRLSASPGGVDR